MVLLVDLPAITDLLRFTGVPEFLQQLAARLEADYKRWNSFHHQPRLVHDAQENGVPYGVLELMPTTDDVLYTFKYVNGHPRLTVEGKMTVVAFGMLAEVRTGYPLMISEMTLLTALRTAATSAMACKYLMTQGATRQAIIGCGAQAEFQVLAMSAVCGLNEVTYYDRDAAAMEKLGRNLQRYPYLKLRAASSVEDAVADAEVVTTATAAKTRSEIVPAASVRAGVHYNAIGGDSPGKTEFSLTTLERCKIFVEFEPQTRVEGEIQQLPASFPVTPLHQLVSTPGIGRTRDDEITLYDSVGYALEDFSTLTLVHELAQKHKMGRAIDLIPDIKNPKDLFGVLQVN